MSRALPGAVLVYDGDCGFCERSARFALGRSTTLRIADHRSQGLDHIDAVMLVDDDGNVWSAAPAVAQALRRFRARRWRALGVVISMPPVCAIAGVVYSLVARNRGRLSKLFGAPACGVPTDDSANR
jgi:predicted DCC family thiol-disulfide oxidoreductase YuxK